MFRTRMNGVGALIGAGLIATVLLAGCGDGGATAGPTTGGTSAAAVAADQGGQAAAPAPSSTAPPQPHNQADVAFATTMIPHNVQALASTQMASTKAANPQIKALASKLGKTQVPQIESLSRWMVGWGQQVPNAAVAGNGPAGSGMLTQADLSKLGSATGADFDKLWLTTMIKHEQGAVALAKTELAHGSSVEAKALAKKIIAAQQAQVTEMQALLKKA
jgi:uncharacterized protein (DUF305 family)